MPQALLVCTPLRRTELHEVTKGALTRVLDQVADDCVCITKRTANRLTGQAKGTHLGDCPSPDSHAHVHSGDEGSLVHFSCGTRQQPCLSPPNGWGREGGARGWVMSMGRDLLNKTLQSACIICGIGPSNLLGLPMGHRSLCLGRVRMRHGERVAGVGTRGVWSNHVMLENAHVGNTVLLPCNTVMPIPPLQKALLKE